MAERKKNLLETRIRYHWNLTWDPLLEESYKRHLAIGNFQLQNFVGTFRSNKQCLRLVIAGDWVRYSRHVCLCVDWDHCSWWRYNEGCIRCTTLEDAKVSRVLQSLASTRGGEPKIEHKAFEKHCPRFNLSRQTSKWIWTFHSLWRLGSKHSTNKKRRVVCWQCETKRVAPMYCDYKRNLTPRTFEPLRKKVQDTKFISNGRFLR